MNNMTEKEDKFQTLLINCLEEMKLPKENIIAIITMLQKEKRYYAGLDKKASQGESQQAQSNVSSEEYQRRSTRLIKTGADSTNYPRVIEIDDTLAFITPQGEIYGFVDKDGNMYLDETIIDASHPIHEYTHLWDRALTKNNPQFWKATNIVFVIV